MIKSILARIQQGNRTIGYPQTPATIPDRFRGLPVIKPEACQAPCRQCQTVCPTGALTLRDKPTIDMGLCLFCGECAKACPAGAINLSKDYRLATRHRQDLVLSGQVLKRAEALDRKSRSLFGRSLKLRQVSAGGCNACEADINVLTTVVFDLGRFGIQIVASPRHADGLLITGPVTQNMKLALEKTYQAVPEPRLVVAVGACAISGGPYAGHPEQNNGASGIVPVDLFVPGCPPHPLTLLDGLLRLLGRI